MGPLRYQAHPWVLCIETRFMIAYGLILVLVLASISLVLFVRRNSNEARYERQQKRDRVRREARFLEK